MYAVWEAACLHASVRHVPYLFPYVGGPRGNSRHYEIELVAGVMTDPIADMLARLRNAILARHLRVRIPQSKVKEHIAAILRDEGFIRGFELVEDGKRAWLDIELRYLDVNRPALAGSKRISKPGLRVYSRAREIPRIMGGIGVALVSTSQGLMTGREAYQRRLGGEVICFVW